MRGQTQPDVVRPSTLTLEPVFAQCDCGYCDDIQVDTDEHIDDVFGWQTGYCGRADVLDCGIRQ
jgi:hypothetical protein